MLKEVYSIDDQAAWLFLFSIWLTVLYYHFHNRVTELEARVIKPDYSRIKAQIEYGERHKPLHQQPTSLAGGGAIVSWIEEKHEILFEDFRWFGAVLNPHLAEQWSIEEINDTSAKGYDAPDIGRQYHIWYNAFHMGRMQVTCGDYWSPNMQSFAENRQANVKIELNCLNFVPYEDALNLISQIILYIGTYNANAGESERIRAQGLASHALAGHLWEVVREPDYSSCFDFSFEGPYDLLRISNDHWSKKGIDPFKKWGGDRENV